MKLKFEFSERTGVYSIWSKNTKIGELYLAGTSYLARTFIELTNSASRQIDNKLSQLNYHR